MPRYLTEAQFSRLETTIQTETSPNGDDDYFNRAWFYLLAHGGLRISEALNLRLGDCDFRHNRLRIRSGKGDRDRVIPITPQLKQVLVDYLVVRGSSATDHLLLARGKPVGYQLVYQRLQKFGQRAAIPQMSPHRLRHTLATLLINAGMPIVSLQKLLGHQNINETLIYARVHDETVRQQFAAAMKQVEAMAKTEPTPILLAEDWVETFPLPDV